MTWWAFAVELELEGWDRVTVAAAVSDRCSLVLRDDDAVRRWFASLRPDDLVWTHGGGSRELIYLAGLLPDLRWTGRTGGGSLLSLRPRGGPDCRDVTALVPLSMEDWTGHDPECCLERASVLLAAVRREVDRLERAGLSVRDRSGVPRLTMGSVAWATAAREAQISTSEPLHWSEYEAGQRGYYGGRSEVGQTSAPVVEPWDVRSAYPWALTLPVPVGVRRSVGADDARRALGREAPGVYHARVIQRADDPVPYLPHRGGVDGRGRGRRGPLIWSTGVVEGWWVLPELRAALALGARLDAVYGASIWPATEARWAPYVDLVSRARARARAEGDVAWEAVLKLAGNALSGKLAQGVEGTAVQVLSRAERPALGWRWHGGRVWSRAWRHVPPCARPIEASYVTAALRTRLLAALLRHAESWIYCDTDGVILPPGCDLRGDVALDWRGDLGAWRSLGIGTDYLALGPKLYRYRDSTGRDVVRARGIPAATWEAIDALARGTVVRRTGAVRWRSGARLGMREIARSWRGVPGWVGHRRVAEDGRTHPLVRLGDGSYVAS